jgi:hypothetical protein
LESLKLLIKKKIERQKQEKMEDQKMQLFKKKELAVLNTKIDDLNEKYLLLLGTSQGDF